MQMTDYTGVFTPLAMDRSLPSKASIQPIILLLAAKAINAALHGAPPARWIVVPSSLILTRAGQQHLIVALLYLVVAIVVVLMKGPGTLRRIGRKRNRQPS